MEFLCVLGLAFDLCGGSYETGESLFRLFYLYSFSGWYAKYYALLLLGSYKPSIVLYDCLQYYFTTT